MKKIQSLIFIIISSSSPLTFAGTYWNPSYTWAHYWVDSSISIRLHNGVGGTIGQWAAGQSTGDYNVSTDLYVSLVTSGEDITLVEANFGEFPFGGTVRTWAAARPKNESGQWCTSLTPYPTFNGNCTTSPGSKAESGKIYVNTYYTAGLDWPAQTWTLSHELGHMIGLYHSDPEVSFSIMRGKYNDSVYYYLESALKSFINLAY